MELSWGNKRISIKINIDLKETKSSINLRLTNVIWQIVSTKNYKSTNLINFILDTPKGVYFLNLKVMVKS
jgi:hypothetical protein